MNSKRTDRITERTRQLENAVHTEKYGALENGLHESFKSDINESSKGTTNDKQV